MLRKAVFLVLATAFFVIPQIFPAARNWAPGLAVLAGIVFSVSCGNPFREKTGRITSPMLGATIVGMGFGMNLMEVLRAGGNGFLYTLIGIVLGIGLGALLGRLLKIPRNAAYLDSMAWICFKQKRYAEAENGSTRPLPPLLPVKAWPSFWNTPEISPLLAEKIRNVTIISH